MLSLHAIVHRLVLGATLLVAPACSGPTPPDTIERERFIEAYVGLRAAALRAGLATVTPPLRDSVLAEVGVAASELVEFVSVHGEDVTFMRSVWDEVTERLQEMPLDAGGSDAPAA